MTDLEHMFKAINRFYSGDLTARIGLLEGNLMNRQAGKLGAILAHEGLDVEIFNAALGIKSLVGQINVAIHAIGILICLPVVLEADEIITTLSLGAGSTGKRFNLETDRRVAEFTFTQWRGGAEAIRQNRLFVDLFNLAEYGGNKERYFYMIDKTIPLRFLNGNRSISSILSRNMRVGQEFNAKYGDKYSVVSEYYNHIKDRVKFIELKGAVSGIRF